MDNLLTMAMELLAKENLRMSRQWLCLDERDTSEMVYNEPIKIKIQRITPIPGKSTVVSIQFLAYLKHKKRWIKKNEAYHLPDMASYASNDIRSLCCQWLYSVLTMYHLDKKTKQDKYRACVRRIFRYLFFKEVKYDKAWESLPLLEYDITIMHHLANAQWNKLRQQCENHLNAWIDQQNHQPQPAVVGHFLPQNQGIANFLWNIEPEPAVFADAFLPPEEG